MSPALRPARATDVYRLQQFPRTPSPPCWVAEVETWVLRDAWHWYRDPSNRAATLLVGEDSDGDLLSVCGYTQIARGTWYLPGLFVPIDARGNGAGSSTFRALLRLLSDTCPGDTAVWVVHPENSVMLALSTQSGASTSVLDLPCNGGLPAPYRRFELSL